MDKMNCFVSLLNTVPEGQLNADAVKTYLDVLGLKIVDAEADDFSHVVIASPKKITLGDLTTAYISASRANVPAADKTRIEFIFDNARNSEEFDYFVKKLVDSKSANIPEVADFIKLATDYSEQRH